MRPWVHALPGCLVCFCIATHAVAQSANSGNGGSSSTKVNLNESNDPVTPKLTLEYWNYFSPVLNRSDGTAENSLARVLIPFTVDGIQNHFHANNKNFGSKNLQAGVAGVTVFPSKWGLISILGTYQHTTGGPSSSLTTIQTNLFYNLSETYYFRSSGITQINTNTHTAYVPVGLGLGKVIGLSGGNILNIYAEAQPSIYRSGRGAPVFQAFFGIELQFDSKLTSGLKF